MSIFLVLAILSTAAGKATDDLNCGYKACHSIDPNALNVHIVPHSHDDVGWERTVDQYYFERVENVLSSVVAALRQNPERRFVQCESAFFKKWWEFQSDLVKADVRALINNGQLEIVNGGWSANDEAAVTYQFIIDQYTIGLRFLQDILGNCTRPTVAWQVDSFGHSREQASVSAQMGFDSIFFARVDYRDKATRLEQQTADLLWRGSAILGNSSDIFASVLFNHYSSPSGFCFDINCDDELMIVDEESPDFNYQRRINQFADYVGNMAQSFITNNVLVVMGDDFRYQDAFKNYINMDRLIKGFDLYPQIFQNKPLKVFYSTPSCYAKAVNDYVVSHNYNLTIKTDDFFPYADGIGSYVVGYFTSRANTKGFIRKGNNLLQIAKQLSAATGLPYENPTINSLREIMGVLQHHDAITGTEQQPVADDYHRMLYKAMKNTDPTIDRILSTLIRGDNNNNNNFKLESCLFANVSSCPQTDSDRFTVVVYNPSSWQTSTSVSLPVTSLTWRIQDPNGREVDRQVYENFWDFGYVDNVPIQKNTLEFLAEDVPAMGFKVYRLQKGEEDGGGFAGPIQSRIGYETTNFEINTTTGLISSITMNGITLDVSQDFFYYKSGRSQAWVFTPSEDEPTRISEGPIKVTPIAGDLFQGVIQEFSDWAKQTVKVYRHDQTLIEFEWIIGPINIGDGGKEVISRFTTGLKTDGVFYTDSNGRETLKRTRNFRSDYEYTHEQEVSGNYYPITSKIAITDGNVEVALVNDRAQGGSSIKDGQVELMVHRAITNNDLYGVNEQEYGRGMVVRGKHFLLLGQKNSTATVERKTALKKLLAPWSFVSNQSLEQQNLKNLEWSNLKESLPESVQILTLESWRENTILIRLEHIYENGEEEIIDLSESFTSFKITKLEETTLAGNILWEEDEKFFWPGGEVDGDSSVGGNVDGMRIVLKAMEIRTFWATVTYDS